MENRKIISYVVNVAIFVLTLIITFFIFSINKNNEGITYSEFFPIRNCMFAIGVLVFTKFYLWTGNVIKESKKWFYGYLASLVLWVIFLGYSLVLSYFANVRTMFIASFALMVIVNYLEYGMIEDKK